MIYGENWWGWESWHGYCPGHCYTSCTDSAINDNWMHPNICNSEPARAWESPISGVVRVVGRARKVPGAGTGGGDGVVATIWKNGTLLWSRTIAYNDDVGYSYDLSISMSPGDRIYFRVNQRSNPNWDGTEFAPIIMVAGDRDSDGLDNFSEVIDYHTNPFEPDTDFDGLSDGTEVYDTHTDPLTPDHRDSDGDGLLDGTELHVTHTNPNNPDTDGDGVNDGAEVGQGSNPNNSDTDGDGVGDALDPTPLVPGVPGSWIEERLRQDAADVLGLNLGLMDAPNNNAAAGRRWALSQAFTTAANLFAQANREAVLNQFLIVRARLDGGSAPPDWMVDGPEKDAMLAEVDLMIYLLGLP